MEPTVPERAVEAETFDENLARGDVHDRRPERRMVDAAPLSDGERLGNLPDDGPRLNTGEGPMSVDDLLEAASSGPLRDDVRRLGDLADVEHPGEPGIGDERRAAGLVERDRRPRARDERDEHLPAEDLVLGGPPLGVLDVGMNTLPQAVPLGDQVSDLRLGHGAPSDGRPGAHGVRRAAPGQSYGDRPPEL